MLILALQHMALALVFLIYPAAAAVQIGLDPAQSATLIAGCIIAGGFGTILQHLRPPLGAGILGVQIPTPIFLPAIIKAGSIGGLGLISGMVLVTACCEIAFSRLLRFVKAIFPPEVCGIAVMMLGVSLARPGFRNFVGYGAGDMSANISLQTVSVAFVTLATIIGIAVFAKGAVKVLALAFGLLAGVGLSMLFGQIDAHQVELIQHAPMFGLPRISLTVPRFDPSLLPLFVVMAVVLSVDDLGLIVSIQRQADPNWKSMDVRKASGAIFASGLADALAALLSGMPTGLSSTHVGLAYATGVTARIIGACTGGMLLLAAFMPKLVLAISIIPRPVVGAIMVYAAAYMLVAGMSVVLSRMLSERRAFTIGLAVLAGLTPELIPHAYDHVPLAIAPIFQSHLAISVFVAIFLNQLFRIGASRQARTVLDAGRSPHEAVHAFLTATGANWGARRDVIERASAAVAEALETLLSLGAAQSDIALEASLDESRLRICVEYSGVRLPLPEQRPDLTEAVSDTTLLPQLGGYIVRRLADEVSQRSRGGREHLILAFDH
jgi:xanthine permease XanP